MIRFNVHGLSVGFSSNNAQFEELLASYYHFLIDSGSDRTPPRGELEFVLKTDSVFEQPSLIFPRLAGDTVRIEFGPRATSAEIDPRGGPILVTATSLAGLPVEALLDSIFMYPLKCAIKRWGFFFMHASCMALARNEGALFFGPPRAGKSSIVLALLREGCFYLAEDSPLVSRRDGELRLYSFPEALGIRKETLAAFPETAPWCKAPPDPFVKHRVSIEKLYRDRIMDSCLPRLIFFVQYEARRSLDLSEVPQDEALLKLMDEELVVYQQGPATTFTQEHMSVLADIVGHTRAYRLRYSDGDLPQAACEVIRLLQSVG